MANSAPTDILITGGTVREQEQNGILVATLAAVDGDPGETFTYSITSDPSGAFTIVGNEIRVLSGLAIDFETANSLPITVEVTDSASNTFSKSFNIAVLDLNEITGTESGETLNGTIGDDLIDALGGDDTVYANAGSDLVYGGDGVDKLYGSFGNDTLEGGTGNDTLYGEQGTDTLRGNDGNDNLQDVVTGVVSSGNVLEGGAGTDTLSVQGAGATGNTLDGGADGDNLQVNSNGSNVSVSNNTLTGGIGIANDNLSVTISGGNVTISGNTLSGGDGVDYLTLDTSFNSDITLTGNTLDGGAGNDVIKLYNYANSINAAADNTFLGGDGNDTIDLILTAPSSNTLLDGGTGNDFLRVSPNSSFSIGDVILLGGDGDDTLSADRRTTVTLDGGTGNNTFNVSSVTTATLDGGTGNNTFNVSSVTTAALTSDVGNDTINLNSSGGIITAGGGADKITANTFTGTLDAGAGIDTVELTSFNGTLTLGSEQDTLKFGNLGQTITVTDFAAGAGGDKLDVTPILTLLAGYDGSNPFGSGYMRLVQDGTDTLLQVDQDASGSGAAYTTLARLQNTTAGDFTSDNFNPPFPPDVVVFLGTEGDDILTGAASNDLIYGFGGNDTLSGAAGQDTIYGGAGNDTIVGGRGNDTLYGEEGNDTFMLSVSEGADAIDGGADFDTLNISGDFGGYVRNDFLRVVFDGANLTGVQSGTLAGIEAVTADLGSGTNTLVYTTPTNAGVTVDLTNGTASGFASIANITNVTGGSGADVIIGNAGGNVLNGGGGNDVLSGGIGLDVLNGAGGTDTASYAGESDGFNINLETGIVQRLVGGAPTAEDQLSSIENVIGGAGADTIIGSAANNVITTGGGDDSVSGGGGLDTVILDGNRYDYTVIVDDAGGLTLDNGTDFVTIAADVETITFTGGGSLDRSAPVRVFNGAILVDTYETIQAAISASTTLGGAGWTIEVVQATYTAGPESITINKALTIETDTNVGIDPNTGPARGPEVMLSKVDIVSSGVTLDGFTISIPGASLGVSILDASNVTVRNNIFLGQTGTSLGADYSTPAPGNEAGSGLVIENNRFISGSNASGMTVTDYQGTNISGNVLAGSGEFGIALLGNVDNATVDGNAVTGYKAGVFLSRGTENAATSGTTIQGNVLTGNGTAIWLNTGTGLNSVNQSMASLISIGGGAEVVDQTKVNTINLAGPVVQTSDLNATLNDPTWYWIDPDEQNGAGYFNGLQEALNASDTGATVTLSGDAHGSASTTVDGLTVTSASDLASAAIQLAALSAQNIAISGGANVTVTGNNSANIINGGTSSGALVIDGGNEYDTLTGGSGADTIIGGRGNDVLTGGGGDDVFLYTVGEGADAINGGADFDTMSILGDFGGYVRNDFLKVVFDGANLTGVQSGTLTGVESVTADLGGGINTLVYTTPTNAGLVVDLTAGTASGFNSIASISNVTGGGGADAIIGNGASNVLNGGTGNDVLTGGGGNDTMNGGGGSDTFLFNYGFGDDTILAFDANPSGGQDYLDLTLFGIGLNDFDARVLIDDLGVDTLITIDSLDTILLTGVNGDAANVITVDDFFLA